jgi:hypothetical protein
MVELLRPAMLILSVFAVVVLLLNVPNVVPGNWSTVGAYVAPISIAIAFIGLILYLLRRA